MSEIKTSVFQMTNKIISLFLLTLLFSCVKNDEPKIDYSICNLDMESFDSGYGIDYDTPEKYLLAGDQSEISQGLFQEIKDSIGSVPKNLTGVLKVCHWVNRNFTKVSGNDIGNKTAQQLYAVKTIYDAHSAALIISATLRKFGFPAVLIEAGSVQWAYDYRLGDRSRYTVHVMTEVFVSDKWILLDNNCTFVTDYDPLNPYISVMNKNLYPKGLFVYAKGRDSWEYDVRRPRDTEEKVIEFANNIICYEEMFYTVDYIWKN